MMKTHLDASGSLLSVNVKLKNQNEQVSWSWLSISGGFENARIITSPTGSDHWNWSGRQQENRQFQANKPKPCLGTQCLNYFMDFTCKISDKSDISWVYSILKIVKIELPELLKLLKIDKPFHSLMNPDIRHHTSCIPKSEVDKILWYDPVSPFPGLDDFSSRKHTARPLSCIEATVVGLKL
jgi:hypothetical protein